MPSGQVWRALGRKEVPPSTTLSSLLTTRALRLRGLKWCTLIGSDGGPRCPKVIHAAWVLSKICSNKINIHSWNKELASLLGALPAANWPFPIWSFYLQSQYEIWGSHPSHWQEERTHCGQLECGKSASSVGTAASLAIGVIQRPVLVIHPQSPM